MIAQRSSKCVYSGFCWRCAIIHLAIKEPPRLTMPVTRWVVKVQMLQQHTAVDRHVVDTLLRLVLDHVQEVLRLHVFDVATQFLEHLVDRHGPDRDRRLVDDQLPDAVDVLAGRQVHHRVGAEMHGRVQLLQFDRFIAGHGASCRCSH